MRSILSPPLNLRIAGKVPQQDTLGQDIQDLSHWAGILGLILVIKDIGAYES